MRDSIILTVYNRPVHVLENTLRALFKNDLEDCEVIVVDDGSNQPVLEPATPDWWDHDKVRWIKTNTLTAHPATHHINGHNNPAYVNNLALEKARGDHITFLSSDCIIPPHTLTQARKHPRAMWVPRVMDMDTGQMWLHKKRLFPMCWFVRAPREACPEFDEEYLKGIAFEDNDWTARVALATEEVVLDESVTIFHQSHPLVAYTQADGTVPSKPTFNDAYMRSEAYTRAKWGGIPWLNQEDDPLHKRWHFGDPLRVQIRRRSGNQGLAEVV